MRKIRKSLLFRLTVPCLSAVLFLGVAYTGFWSGRYESEVEARFLDTSERTVALFSQAVAEPLWQFDSGATERILAGFLQSRGYEYSAVFDRGGVFAVNARDGRERVTPKVDFEGIERLERLIGSNSALYISPIIHPDHGQLGHLVASYSMQPMIEMKSTARRDANLAALTAFGLLGLLLALVARSVIRPIAHITEVVERVAKGDTALEVPHVRRLDEVGRLARALEIFRRNENRLIEAQAEAKSSRRIAELAVIDELTGLSNRRAVENWFADVDRIKRDRSEGGYAILHIDLDRFKRINDTFGHSAGDHVIGSVAERLKAFSDRCAIIARIGGDEFMMAVRQSASSDRARLLAEDVVAALAQPLPFGTQMLRCGASIGVAANSDEDAGMAETLVNADIALYRAKSEGKGRVVVFDKSHRQEVEIQSRFADEILQSIEDRRFVPHFQPIVRASDFRIAGLEVLARWDHPTRGILPPDAFLKCATDLNLLHLIDLQVFEQAIASIAELKQVRRGVPSLSINFSAERLLDDDIRKLLARAEQTGIEINLELLESAFFDDMSDRMIWQLDRMREKGVGVHIDDFGTGHASIAGLLRVSPDALKIDRQFVLPALDGDREQDLVKFIVGIAHLLNIDVIAEGVETREHADFLTKIGVRSLQGFYFAKPMPFEALAGFLARSSVGVRPQPRRRSRAS